MLNARRVILESYADAVGLLDDVAVGNDVSLGIDQNSGSQRTLLDVAATGTTLSTLASKEAVKEIVKWAAAATVRIVVFIPRARTRPAALPVRILDGGFSVDVDHGGFERLGNLRKGVGKLLRGGHA